MRLDSGIERNVEDELRLRWGPDIASTEIGVTAHNGVAALTGFVRSYARKIELALRAEAGRSSDVRSDRRCRGPGFPPSGPRHLCKYVLASATYKQGILH